MSETGPEAPLGRGAAFKLLVLSPPFLSGAASVLLLAMSPLAWGAADRQGLAPWAPPAGLIVIAVTMLAMDAWAVRALRRRLQGLFEVDMTWAVVGAVSHWVAAVCMVTFAGWATSQSAYESLGADSTSTAGFLFLVAVTLVVFGGLLFGMTAAYVWAVTPGRQTRLGERREDEVDIVDEWVRRRPRRR
jgi:uncharacterized membrane protein